MNIAIGSDHAGFALKQLILAYLNTKAYTVKDFGCFSVASVDYPDYAHPVAIAIEQNDYDFGILICGSGNGVCMSANKHAGIRAALAWKPELAELARQHNNANILCLPARFIENSLAIQCVEQFLNTGFEGGRHQRRVNKI